MAIVVFFARTDPLSAPRNNWERRVVHRLWPTPNQHKKEALAAQARDHRTGGPFCGRYVSA